MAVRRGTPAADRRRAAQEKRLEKRPENRIAGRRLLDADDVSCIEERIDTEEPARRVLEAMAVPPESEISEFRDPGRLEEDLADHGVRTDITYLPQRKRCAGRGRSVPVDPQPPRGVPMKSKKMQEWLQRNTDNVQTARAFQWPSPRKRPNVFEIFPEKSSPGRRSCWSLVNPA